MFGQQFASISDAWGNEYGSQVAAAKMRKDINDPLCELYSKQYKDVVEGYDAFNEVPAEHVATDHARTTLPLANSDGTVVKKKLKKVTISKGELILDAFRNTKEDDDEMLDNYINDNTQEPPLQKHKYIDLLTLIAAGIFLIIMLDLFFRMGVAYAKK
eukprot:gene19682-26369_t